MMYELALFPLNTVLFPSTPLHLHIFENRYKRMVGECISQQKPFGVVLIRRGDEALGALADPHRIGCTAHIIEIEHLPQGRFNLTVMGKDRFRILSLDSQSHPYLVGVVENYPVAEQSLEVLQPAASRLQTQLMRYLRLLVEAGLIELDTSRVPENPLIMAYFSAALLQIPALQKQKLLSIHDAQTLINRLITIYIREVALTRKLLRSSGTEQGSFSAN
jgi:Lon protease-like protein